MIEHLLPGLLFQKRVLKTILLGEDSQGEKKQEDPEEEAKAEARARNDD
jgi:hypothetical protein